MFTGKDLNGSFVGYSLGCDTGCVGVVCTDNAYSISQPNFDPTFAFATDLAAHEIGHMWSANHNDAVCPGFTMNSTIQEANMFCQTTIDAIVAYRDSVLSCLAEPIDPAAQCGLSEQHTVADPSQEGDSTYGLLLDIDGNILIVGDSSDDGVAQNAGTVYVYRFDGVDWSLEQQLFASDAASNRGFGIRVAASGDSIVVSSSGGRAYIFRYNSGSGTWAEVALLMPYGGSSSQITSVSIDGDICAVGSFIDLCAMKDI